jgi:tetratricopeptide (TPR) repeat protein
MQNFDRSIEITDRGIQLDPTNLENFFWRGRAYQALGKYDLALNDYKKCLDLRQDDSSTIEVMAWSYFRLKKYQEAILYANRAIATNPTSTYSLHTRGSTFYATNDYRSAIADFNTILKIDPKYPGAYKWRGYSNTYIKNYEQAILDFDRAIELDKKAEDSYLYSGRAFAKQQLDRKVDAIADYQQALQIAQKEGKADKIKSLKISIEDIQNEPQRLAIATFLTLILTGASYGSLLAIDRRNEAKYLAQFQD